MTVEKIPLDRLEDMNDILAEGIDQAGDASEIFLAKVTFYLATHLGTVEDLRTAVSKSLLDADLPRVA